MGVRGSLEYKYYQCINMALPFQASFIDSLTRFVWDAPMTSVGMKYFEFVFEEMKD